MTKNLKRNSDKRLEDKVLIVDEVGFGKLLAKLIDRSGETQTDIAVRAKTTQPIVSAICNQRRQCGLRLATRFADALKLKGHERITFLGAAKMPQWKGFNHELYGPEAVLYDILSKTLTSNRINLKDVQSVTPLDPQRAAGSAVIVMKDGKTLNFSLSVEPSSQMETAKQIERNIGALIAEIKKLLNLDAYADKKKRQDFKKKLRDALGLIEGMVDRPDPQNPTDGLKTWTKKEIERDIGIVDGGDVNSPKTAKDESANTEAETAPPKTTEPEATRRPFPQGMSPKDLSFL